MSIEKFCVKFFSKVNKDVDQAIFINIFHEWIRYKQLDGILLDVVDYRHVPNGPGIMLITHHINFAMDHGRGQFGLLAQRKVGQGSNHVERILDLIQATQAFGTLLESDWRIAGQFKLAGDTFHYISNDRLLAPNNEATFAALKPDLEAASAIIYPGQDVSITRLENHPRERLTIEVKAAKEINIAKLLKPVEIKN